MSAGFLLTAIKKVLSPNSEKKMSKKACNKKEMHKHCLLIKNHHNIGNGDFQLAISTIMQFSPPFSNQYGAKKVSLNERSVAPDTFLSPPWKSKCSKS